MPNTKSFLMIVMDDDKRVFNVLGPMTDDTDLNSRVSKAQDDGRNVRCSSVMNATKEELISRGPSELSLDYDPDFFI